ncbi:2-polyprenylphenol 6-hydroxylase [Phreatobacter stygius]|uniref:2-polyprenylphenol 6-hydroxylase n=1 Tax=Phreatobacter stygius TaxID=1940610 RepID=A0A4D7B2W0_9HYPH|nr:2-polyprenylphenol 6-hydroxylase [Phreatobacter stygius]QCI65393.1 2-polyprenylphenol 6-hydroxylase [Phreatobacter stygius]
MLGGLVHILRLGRAGFVFAREGVFGLVDLETMPRPARLGLRLARLIERRRSRTRSDKLTAALTRLGPTYVKLGQFLSTRPDVVGPAIASDLEALQDQVPPFDQADAERIVSETLGQPVSELFSSFGPAIAAASVAQVHKARTRDNGIERDVAVKVLRPGVADRFRADLSDYYFAARFAERFAPDSRRLRPIGIVDTLARSMAIELDMRLEAAAASEMADRTKGDPAFRVPEVDWNRTGKLVLTTEWIDGIRLGDRDALAKAGIDPEALGRTVIQSFLRHALRDGFFHADMHQGNLFADERGNLVAVDFGIMGRIGPKERRFLAEILLGFITKAYRRVAEVHFEAGYVPGHHSIDEFAQAIRAIGEPIHSRTADQISMAKLLSLLFEVTAIFEMTTRTELILLQKTMVVVEGVARSLDPKLDMWSTAEPVVREWISRNLGPVGRLQDVGEGALTLGKIVGDVPILLARAAMLSERVDELTRDGFVLSPQSLKGIGEAEARRNRWSTVALWLIAALLAANLLLG